MKNAPGKEEVESSWREIYGGKVSHNEEACWIKDQRQHNPSMEWSRICEKDVASSIGTTLPGLFGKPNWVEPELEGDVSAAPFGDGCKKGIRGAKDR